jgi:aquaporin Z
MTTVPQELQAARKLTQSDLQPTACWIAYRPEYLVEGALLGLFMVSACVFTVLFQSASLPLAHTISSMLQRRALTGVAMGLTAVALVYSSWGGRSGAHMNPAVTLTFLRLGRVEARDAAGYIAAQFAGSIAGVAIARLILGAVIAGPTVQYAATYPGESGLFVAAAAEFLISLVLMTAVLQISSRPALSKFTGLVAGLLVAIYITLEAPYSGMSMNPARTLGSAVYSGVWRGFWIYVLLPPAGMLTAAELFLLKRGKGPIPCCKLHHDSRPCIFCTPTGGTHE